MSELDAIRAELERRSVEAIKAELHRRQIAVHLRTVYPDDWEWRVNLVNTSVLDNEFIPADVRRKLTVKQAELLAHQGAECLYGGAARGGKSYAALIAAAQFVDRPDYHALILRRNYAQMSKADSILNLSKSWWYGRVKWNGEDRKWTFPSGATIEFGHMEGPDSHLNYQGAVWQTVVFDELTQFPQESQYQFLFTRQSRPEGSDLPIRVIATSNPGGPGHFWVKNRFIDPKTKKADAHFIPAKLDDNPNVDRAAYRASLTHVDPVTRDQMLAGNWDAIEGGRFQKEWFRYYRREGDFFVLRNRANEIVERFMPAACPRWQTCDPAASTSAAADHFVLSTWCLSPLANLVWLECHRAKYEIPEQVGTAQMLYRRWHPQFLAVEEVANQRALAQLLRRSLDPKMVIHPVSPLGKDKSVRATPSLVIAAAGQLYLPEDDRSFPLEDVQGELIMFTGEDGNPDDICDTLFYAVETMPMVKARGGGGSFAAMPVAVDTSQVGAKRFVTQFNGYGPQPKVPNIPGVGRRKNWWD